MEFRIADTFTASLARLTGDEQKAVKTTAFDLQLNPAQPGMKLHKLDKARDKNFWSVRVTSDIRLIVHRMDGSFMLCYVDHHDKAYEWASRRRLETHPKTGAAQWVEVRDVAPVPMILGAMVSVSGVLKASIGIPQPALKGVSREDLLGYGVPSDWADEVLAADEDELLKLADHLPAEAAEALLELATGGRPKAPAPAPAGADPFSHPDAQRRFRVMRDTEELARALEFPWDRWTTFLHPAQRQLVESSFKGPARVGGSAGTGKTIVALHRAVVLARRHPDARVLLTTFSDPLARALHVRLRRLLSQEHEPRLAERLEVEALDAVAVRLHARLIGRVTLASPCARTADIASPRRSCWVNGWTPSMPGILPTGPPIATSSGWVGCHGCPRRSGRCCGRCSSTFGRVWRRRVERHDHRCSMHWHSGSRRCLIRLSISSSSMRPRMWTPRRCASCLLSGEAGRMPCSSQVISGSAFSRRRSLGLQPASTFAAVRARCR